MADDDAVSEIARNEDDDEILETLSGTCRVLRNEYWETFVNIGQYDRLQRGEGKILAFHSVLQPEIFNGFASVHMASANFEDSQVFKVWSSLGIEFKPDPQFAGGLRYYEHPNGECVTIYYVTDHQWSRKRQRSCLRTGQQFSTTWCKRQNSYFQQVDFGTQTSRLTKILLDHRQNVFQISHMALINSWTLMMSYFLRPLIHLPIISIS